MHTQLAGDSYTILWEYASQMNQIKEDSRLVAICQVKAKKIKHVLNCLTLTQRKFAIPAAQDKIVYLHFIWNCIVKSVACVLMFSCIVYLRE